MTTGNRTVDRMSNKLAPDGTTINVGSYSQKVWSGGDAPPRPKAPKYTKTGFRIVESLKWVKPHRNRKTGKKIPGRWVKVRKLAYEKTLNPRPPREKRGEHPYSMTFRAWSARESSFRYSPFPNTPFDQQTVGYFGWPSIIGPPIFTDVWNENDELALINKLRSRLNGSDFHLGVFLAEAPLAVKMIGDAAVKIARALHCIKRGNFQGAVAAFGLPHGVHNKMTVRKSVSANWLELQYGWKPLLDDVEGGAKFLARCSSKPLSNRYRATRQRASSRHSGPDAVWEDMEGYRRKTIIATVTEVNQPILSGLLDLQSVVWETLPYSFVADWFVPIGSYLSARAFAASLKVETVVTLDKLYRKAGNISMKSDPDGVGVTSVDANGFSYESVDYTRTISTSIEVPLPRSKPLTGVGGTVTWTHAANAIALLVQRHGSGSAGLART